MAREWLLPGASRVRPEAATVDSTWGFMPIREYGSLSGGLAFGIVFDVAVLPKGDLVVADVGDCTLKVVGRPSGKLRARWGGCGDGPSEFRFPSALAVHGDTLFVYDSERNSIAVLDMNGTEVQQRIPVRGDVDGPFSLSHLDVLDDSTLLVSTAAVGASAVATMDRRDGTLRRVLASVPPIAESNSGIRRMGGGCRQPKAQAPAVVAMSAWAMEGVGIVPSDVETERFHFLTDLDLPPRRSRNGNWVPGPWRVNVKCGESLFLARVTTLAEEDRYGDIATVQAASVIWEGRDYDGTLLMRQWITDRNSILRGAPSAFRGDTLFVISNRVRTYPVVGEVLVYLADVKQSNPVKRKDS